MKKIFFAIVLISVILTGSFGIFLLINSRPVSQSTEIKQFVINPGDGADVIARRLESNKLIRDKFVFLLTAYYLKLNSQLQSGLFKLSPSMSTVEVAKTLSNGGSHDYWLKIIGGQRIAELDKEFDISLEGYLFPDSYLIPQDYSIDQITSIISENFSKKNIGSIIF